MRPIPRTRIARKPYEISYRPAGSVTCILAAVICIPILGTPRAGDAQATFTPLGVLPVHTFSYAYGVSADGSVVVGESAYRVFRWTRATGLSGLGELGNLPGEARCVSGDGSVVVGNRGGALGGPSGPFRCCDLYCVV
jgi:hypothetical protein